MREAIGGAWLFGLVITFIVFFASFLALSVNFSKAFNVKNNVVDIVEKYEGFTCTARCKVGDYLHDVGYLVLGSCPSGYTGYDANGNKVDAGKKAYYCIQKDENSNTTVDKTWYRVIVFFKVDLPIMGNLTTFKVKGETSTIYYAVDEQDTSTCTC